MNYVKNVLMKKINRENNAGIELFKSNGWEIRK